MYFVDLFCFICTPDFTEIQKKTLLEDSKFALGRVVMEEKMLKKSGVGT